MMRRVENTVPLSVHLSHLSGGGYDVIKRHERDQQEAV